LHKSERSAEAGVWRDLAAFFFLQHRLNLYISVKVGMVASIACTFMLMRLRSAPHEPCSKFGARRRGPGRSWQEDAADTMVRLNWPLLVSSWVCSGSISSCGDKACVCRTWRGSCEQIRPCRVAFSPAVVAFPRSTHFEHQMVPIGRRLV